MCLYHTRSQENQLPLLLTRTQFGTQCGPTHNRNTYLLLRKTPCQTINLPNHQSNHQLFKIQGRMDGSFLKTAFRVNMDESCHTYEWVMSHIWMSHVTHMKKSCRTPEFVCRNLALRNVWNEGVLSCEVSRRRVSGNEWNQGIFSRELKESRVVKCLKWRSLATWNVKRFCRVWYEGVFALCEM